ncbi:MAG: OmpA family protein [Bacteroidota bacterium]|nr:OmpA family protein [Bacteroidota bacterium]MDP4232392.1 OmpA family protein [Bacteroidota bacterium]MDP4241529.1 OmpA family protein [Bacteroidota bacterium]MDP4288263.1 OmpA family protein [Bacteroidota bacterium]
MISRALALSVLILAVSLPCLGQDGGHPELEKRRSIAGRDAAHTGLQSVLGNLRFTIKNVDITHFPELSVIFSASNARNEFIRTLRKEDLIVLENGQQRPILSLDLVSGENRVPIDIVFVIDQTASMGDVIESVKDNVNRFAEELRGHGFDFRLGLIRFSDVVEWVSPTTTDDVGEFEKWVGAIHAEGGGDPKENALEGLHAIAGMPLRPIALRLAVLVTDAQCHLQGEQGDGTTDFTMKSMGDWLYEREVRLLTVTPPEYPEYHELASLTEGASFDLGQTFAGTIVDMASNITSLYALRYLSQSTLAPDSVRIDLMRAEDRSPLASRKLLAMEPGRRFVFEDLQFGPNQTQLVNEFIPELERVVRLMHVRPAMRIRIEGHADSTGIPDVNWKISSERAVAVKRYLMQSGIAPDRLETLGYGATRPIASNATETGRRLNRRIEFLILAK